MIKDIESMNCMQFKDDMQTSCEGYIIKLLTETVLKNESVVFQANFPQGSGIYMKIYDTLLGMTYLCYSNNIELYQGE